MPEMLGWALLLAGGGLAALIALRPLAAHVLSRPDPGGDGREGLVVFVESIRWLGVRWGLRTAARGLRRAGFRGRLLYWRWHASWRGWLVVPAIADRAMLERQARRLAGFLTRRKRRRPDRPLYVVGYSCGAFVALRALELLPGDVRMDAAALLAGAFAPTRDVRPACDRLAGPLVVCSSLLDCWTVGLGTLLVGTGDRRHCLSAGCVGLRGPAARDERVVQVRWRPAMLRLGHVGGHFSAANAGFVRDHVAPAMGICPPREGR